MTIRAVLFDLDETLIDRSVAIRVFASEQYQRHADLLAGIPAEEYQREFLDIEKGGTIPKKIVYPQLAAKLGLDDAAAETLLDDYTRLYPRYATLRPESKPLLDAVKAMGLRMGIISNGEADVQNGKIEALGIATYLDIVLISSAEGLRKPDPAVFARAAERLGLDVGECVYVGDNPEVDIIGAQSAGMAAIWLQAGMPWPQAAAPAAHPIESLAEVVPIVREIDSAS